MKDRLTGRAPKYDLVLLSRTEYEYDRKNVNLVSYQSVRGKTILIETRSYNTNLVRGFTNSYYEKIRVGVRPFLVRVRPRTESRSNPNLVISS